MRVRLFAAVSLALAAVLPAVPVGALPRECIKFDCFPCEEPAGVDCYGENGEYCLVYVGGQLASVCTNLDDILDG